MTNITKSSCDIANTIAYSVARRAKGSVDAEDLCGHLQEKLVLLDQRFDPSIGVPFDAYIRRSLKGYAWNYLRDNSQIRLPRAYMDLYMSYSRFCKSRPGFSDLPIASKARAMRVSVQALLAMQNAMAMRNSMPVDEFYNTGEPSATQSDEWLAFISLNSWEQDLLEKYAFERDSLSDKQLDYAKSLLAKMA